MMTNLLVAVLSDTYARVTENIAISDQYELNGLILDLELYYFWRRLPVSKVKKIKGKKGKKVKEVRPKGNCWSRFAQRQNELN